MTAPVVIFSEAAFELEVERVVAACSRLGMAFQLCEGDSVPAQAADLAVGFLAPTERHVPSRILRALSSGGGRSLLLLLSRERLRRPAVWLQDRLLVLLGDDPGEMQIASQLRMMSTATKEQHKAGLFLREIRRPEFFAATFTSHAIQPSSPLMVECQDEWIARLPLRTQLGPEPAPYFSEGTPGAGSEGAGDGCGFMRLETKTGLLSAGLPTGWGSLTLASARRAPFAFEFPHRASGELFAQVRTASGDLLVALDTSSATVVRHPDWSKVLRAGAGAVLELLEKQASAGGSVLGAVLEVL